MPLFRAITVRACRLLLVLALISSGVTCVGGALFSAPAQAQGASIRAINVQATGASSRRRFAPISNSPSATPTTPAKVDGSIKALFATGLFSDVRIDRSGADVIVTVVENPVINQIAFEGNSEVDTETLRNEVQLKPRSVFTRARVQADVQRMLDVYRRQGRYAATVEPKIIELEQDRVNLVFEITEGAATKVKGIHFVGNNAFSDSQLRDVISTTEKGWFDFLKGTAVYDPDRMNLDRELLRQYYLKNGYADVQVTAANAELDRDGSGFFITYSIEEGEQYEFGDVNIESTVAAIDAVQVQGRPADRRRRDLQRQPDRQVGREADPRRIAGRLRLRPRPPASDARSGDAQDRAQLRHRGRSARLHRAHQRHRQHAHQGLRHPARVQGGRRRRLQSADGRSGQEAPDQPRPVQGASTSSAVRAAPRTASSSTWSWSSSRRASCPSVPATRRRKASSATVSITERNLMGNGQFLRLQLSGSLERLQVNLSFTEPRFLDRNLAAGFDLFHKEVDQSEPVGLQRAAVPAAACASASRCPRSCGCRPATRSRATRSSTSIDDASLAIQQAEGTSYTSLVGTTLTYDLRNDAKNPTKGLWFQAGRRLRRSRRRRAVRQPRGRSARLLPDHRQHHLRRPRHRRLDRGLGRRGRSPDRPVLQGR